MNLQTIKNQKGFTIVELLIVVVVIGILAAITIVAFTGIQNNARASERQSDAASIVKMAEAINAQTGSYPQTAAAFNAPGAGAAATLPANVRVHATILSAAPANAAAAEHVVSDNEKQYRVRACGANNGVIVYYVDPRDNTVASARAGSGGC